MSFFKVIELFIDKDYDVIKSIEFNQKELERKIEAQHLEFLVESMKDELGNYDAVR